MTHGFSLVKEKNIDELRSHVKLYTHVKTGAELVSVINDDEEKVFGITFRTPPSDSTGVAHILEHCVLSGSKKYPLKEPFAELLKSSLASFLNAWTFPDKTGYPVASANLKDFYNLIDVYLDAVFFPRLSVETFKEQAWHYELENKDSELIYKGVVFNEMKGAFSDPERVLHEYTRTSLFPDITYGISSGGDPKSIPDLTHDQLKEFHKKHYHPSNARVIFYGNDDPEKRLEIMDSVFSLFDKNEVDTTVGIQKKFATPKSFTFPYAVEGEENLKSKGMVTVSWMTEELRNPTDYLAFVALQHMLIGTAAGPLRKALLDSGLGEDFTNGIDAEDDLRQSAFSVGLKNCNPDDTSKIENLVLETLQQLSREGLDRTIIEASLNSLEFRLREINGIVEMNVPKGIELMTFALAKWLHDGDVFQQISFAQLLSDIRTAYEQDAKYFSKLIDTYFVNNTHRITVTLTPDPKLAAKEKAAEKQKLATIKQNLSEEEITQILSDTRALREFQEKPDTPEVAATIPTLRVADLDKKLQSLPLTLHTENNNLSYYDGESNGIVYIDIGFDITNLSTSVLPYTMLFGRALKEMGTKKHDYVSFLQKIGMHTGGLEVHNLVSRHVITNKTVAKLFLSGKAIEQKKDTLADILKEALLNVQLDNKARFKQIVQEEKLAMESLLIDRGHNMVNQRMLSYYDESGWVKEQIGGIDYVLFLRSLIKRIDHNWDEVLSELTQVHGQLVNQTMVVNTTGGADSNKLLISDFENFYQNLPEKNSSSAGWTFQPVNVNEGFIVSAQVNYVGKSLNIFDYGYTMHGSMYAILNNIRNGHLWEKIRMQGGAYGGFNTFDRRTGVYNFISYRDPNVLASLDVYDAVGDFLMSKAYSTEEIQKSIISGVGMFNPYLTVQEKGFTAFVRHVVGESDALLQQYYTELLNTTQEDYKKLGEVLQNVKQNGRIAVLGNKEALEQANKKRNDLLTLVMFA